MARERKWGSDAERKAAERATKRGNPDAQSGRTAAKRTLKTDAASKTDAQVAANPDKTDALPVEAETMPIEPVVAESSNVVRLPVRRSPDLVRFRDCPDVPHNVTKAPWAGVGRMTAVEWQGKRYVMVARNRGTLFDDGVVTEADYLARLSQRCEHGIGWQCHAC